MFGRWLRAAFVAWHKTVALPHTTASACVASHWCVCGRLTPTGIHAVLRAWKRFTSQSVQTYDRHGCAAADCVCLQSGCARNTQPGSVQFFYGMLGRPASGLFCDCAPAGSITGQGHPGECSCDERICGEYRLRGVCGTDERLFGQCCTDR